MTQDNLPPLLTPREVANLLRVGYPTVQRWCKEGAIPAVKIGKAYRIRREDLETWFEARRKSRPPGVSSPASALVP